MFYSWIPLTCIYFAYDHPDEIWVQRLFSILYPSLHLRNIEFHPLSKKRKEKKKKKPSIEQNKQKQSFKFN